MSRGLCPGDYVHGAMSGGFCLYTAGNNSETRKLIPLYLGFLPMCQVTTVSLVLPGATIVSGFEIFPLPKSQTV